jgi:DHA3 family macrolide efflux protein-like MFS transporter
MPSPSQQPSGMRVFTIVWIGQLISLLGTGITRFALVLWAWEITGQATALSLTAFFGFMPIMLMSPIAGALVDRWNRKLVIMLSDFGAVCATLLLLALSLSGDLQIWHIYLTSFIAGLFESFQFPAYSAAVTTMVERKDYARTSAMMGIAETASGIFAPILATAFYTVIHLEGIFIFDIVTCLFAILTIGIARIPQPPITEQATDESKGRLLNEAVYGFKYIWRRPSLFGLQMVFFFSNFLYSLYAILLNAMILARTNNDQLMLRDITTTIAIGGLVSGLLISAWGGPKRRIHGVLMGWTLTGIVPIILMGVGQSRPVWLLAGFVGAVVTAVVNPSNQAIWQAKIPPHIQGRVFSARRMIAQVAGPVALLIAGPLADYVFEPAMQSDGVLASVFGGLVGTSTGSGMALIIILSGVLMVVTGIGAYLVPAIRQVEDIIPDHQDTITPATDSPL